MYKFTIFAANRTDFVRYQTISYLGPKARDYYNCVDEVTFPDNVVSFSDKDIYKRMIAMKKVLEGLGVTEITVSISDSLCKNFDSQTLDRYIRGVICENIEYLDLLLFFCNGVLNVHKSKCFDFKSWK